MLLLLLVVVVVVVVVLMQVGLLVWVDGNDLGFSINICTVGQQSLDHLDVRFKTDSQVKWGLTILICFGVVM